jgi:hypothetical protein
VAFALKSATLSVGIESLNELYKPPKPYQQNHLLLLKSQAKSIILKRSEKHPNPIILLKFVALKIMQFLWDPRNSSRNIAKWTLWPVALTGHSLQEYLRRPKCPFCYVSLFGIARIPQKLHYL